MSVRQVFWVLTATACAGCGALPTEEQPEQAEAEGGDVLLASPPACAGVTTLELPAAGEVQDTLVTSFGANGFTRYVGAEGRGVDCRALGDEAVFVLRVGVATRATFETSSPRDTVLGLVSERCSADIAAASCDDDGGTNRNSFLDVVLVADVDHFVVVDFFGVGATDVMLRVGVPTS